MKVDLKMIAGSIGVLTVIGGAITGIGYSLDRPVWQHEYTVERETLLAQLDTITTRVCRNDAADISRQIIADEQAAVSLEVLKIEAEIKGLNTAPVDDAIRLKKSSVRGGVKRRDDLLKECP